MASARRLGSFRQDGIFSYTLRAGLLCVMLFLSSCLSYEVQKGYQGPERNPEELATIGRCAYAGPNGWLTTVGDVEFPGTMDCVIAVLPGKYTFTGKFMKDNLFTQGFTFDGELEAGKVYELMVDRDFRAADSGDVAWVFNPNAKIVTGVAVFIFEVDSKVVIGGKNFGRD